MKAYVHVFYFEGKDKYKFHEHRIFYISYTKVCVNFNVEKGAYFIDKN